MRENEETRIGVRRNQKEKKKVTKNSLVDKRDLPTLSGRPRLLLVFYWIEEV